MPKKQLILILFLTTSLNTIAQTRSWLGYSVYNALIKTELADSFQSAIIIKELEIENRSADLVEAIKNKNKEVIYFYTKGIAIDSLTQQLIIAYSENQSKTRLLEKGFDLPVKPILKGKKKIDELFEASVADGWKIFYQQYPKSAGIFSFSKAYFSSDRTLAVFYCSHQKGGLNGHGDLVIIENVDNQLRVKYLISLWQS